MLPAQNTLNPERVGKFFIKAIFGRRDFVHCFGLASLSLMVLSSAGLALPSATELPSINNVAVGSVSVQSANGILNINSASGKAIVNYNSFNVGSQAQVNFNLPNAQSAILNRVTGGIPSEIYGKITSNGNVFLTNPSGIIFGPGSQVNVGGLVASTLGMTDNDFIRENYLFSQSQNSGIINQGELTANQIALIGSKIDNQGTIKGQNVYLLAGKEVTLRTADGVILEGKVTKALENSAEDLIKNSGRITSTGGLVKAQAELENNAYFMAVNNTGIIEAEGIVNNGGEIEIISSTGTVVNSGSITANSEQAEGGKIILAGNKTALLDGSEITANGQTKGGEVYIGGGFQGEALELNDGSLAPESNRTFVGQNSNIEANGGKGKVIVWANGDTRYFGSIEALNEGFVEVSGKAYLDFNGAVNTGGGTLLLDPTDITISTSASSGTMSGSSPFEDLASGTSNLNVGVLNAALVNGDVIVTTTSLQSSAGDLTVDATVTGANAISWGNGSSLTLLANNDITILGQIISTGTGGVTLTANSDSLGGGSLVFDSTNSVTTNTGNITLNALGDATQASDVLVYGNVLTTSGNIDVNVARDFVVGTGTAQYVNVGETAPSILPSTQRAVNIGSLDGDINIVVGDDLFIFGGSVNSTQGQIGVINPGVTSNITVDSVGSLSGDGSLYVYGGSGNASYSMLGHGTVLGSSGGTRSGNITIENIANDLLINSGIGTESFAAIGLALSSAADSVNKGALIGNVSVNSVGDTIKVSTEGAGIQSFALLGLGDGTTSGSSSLNQILGDVSVKSLGNINVVGFAPNQSTASIGIVTNGGNSITGANGIVSDVLIETSGNLEIQALGSTTSVGIFAAGVSVNTDVISSVEIKVAENISINGNIGRLGVSIPTNNGRTNNVDVNVYAGKDLSVVSGSNPAAIPFVGLDSAAATSTGTVNIVAGEDLTFTASSGGFFSSGNRAGGLNVLVGNDLTIDGPGGGSGFGARFLAKNFMNIDAGGDINVVSGINNPNFIGFLSGSSGFLNIQALGDVNFSSLGGSDRTGMSFGNLNIEAGQNVVINQSLLSAGLPSGNINIEADSSFTVGELWSPQNVLVNGVNIFQSGNLGSSSSSQLSDGLGGFETRTGSNGALGNAVLLSTTNGNISVLGSDSLAFSQLGSTTINAGTPSTAIVGFTTTSATLGQGDVSIKGNSNLVIDGTAASTTVAGNIDLQSDQLLAFYNSATSTSGNISLEILSGDLVVGTGTTQYALFGETAPSIVPSVQRGVNLGSLSGDLDIEVGDDLFVLGGSAVNSQAQIGSSTEGVNSNISINDIGSLSGNGSLYVIGGTNATSIISSSYAQIGHGGYYKAAGSRTGNISISGVAGNVLLQGGTADGTYAQIGHGGQGFLTEGTSLSGNVNVQNIQGTLTLQGANSPSLGNSTAILGHGNIASGQFGASTITGNVTTDAGNIILDNGTVTQTGVGIGIFGAFNGSAVKNYTGNVLVESRDSISLDANNSLSGIGIATSGNSIVGSSIQGVVDIIVANNLTVDSNGVVLGLMGAGTNVNATGTVNAYVGENMTIASRNDSVSFPILGVTGTGTTVSGTVNVKVGNNLTLNTGIGAGVSIRGDNTNVLVGNNLTLGGLGGGGGLGPRVIGLNSLDLTVGGDISVFSPVAGALSDLRSNSATGFLRVRTMGDLLFGGAGTGGNAQLLSNGGNLSAEAGGNIILNQTTMSVTGLNAINLEADAAFNSGELWSPQSYSINGNPNIFSGSALETASSAHASDGFGGFETRTGANGTFGSTVFSATSQQGDISISGSNLMSDAQIGTTKINLGDSSTAIVGFTTTSATLGQGDVSIKGNSNLVIDGTSASTTVAGNIDLQSDQLLAFYNSATSTSGNISLEILSGDMVVGTGTTQYALFGETAPSIVPSVQRGVNLGSLSGDLDIGVGDDLFLFAGTTATTNWAQIGRRETGTNSDMNIEIGRSSTDANLYIVGGASNTYSQIGHAGFGIGSGTWSGDINLSGIDNLFLNGSSTGASSVAQIGHGGMFITSTSVVRNFNGDINISASEDLELNGGKTSLGERSEALIGHGLATDGIFNRVDNITGDITIKASEISLNGGTNRSGVQIGHEGLGGTLNMDMFSIEANDMTLTGGDIVFAGAAVLLRNNIVNLKNAEINVANDLTMLSPVAGFVSGSTLGTLVATGGNLNIIDGFNLNVGNNLTMTAGNGGFQHSVINFGTGFNGASTNNGVVNIRVGNDLTLIGGNNGAQPPVTYIGDTSSGSPRQIDMTVLVGRDINLTSTTTSAAAIQTSGDLSVISGRNINLTGATTIGLNNALSVQNFEISALGSLVNNNTFAGASQLLRNGISSLNVRTGGDLILGVQLVSATGDSSLSFRADAPFAASQLWTAQSVIVNGQNIFTGTPLASNSTAQASDSLGGFGMQRGPSTDGSSFTTVNGDITILSADRFVNGTLTDLTIGPSTTLNNLTLTTDPTSFDPGDLTNIGGDILVSGLNNITINNVLESNGLAGISGNILIQAANNIASNAGSILASNGAGNITLRSDLNNTGGGNIVLTDATILSDSGDLLADATGSRTNNITFAGTTEFSTQTGDVLGIADNRISLLDTASIDPFNVVLVTDFGTAGVGNGGLTMSAGSSIIATNRILLYTSRPQNNFIDAGATISSLNGGTLDPLTFATNNNGPFFQNQLWGAFYNTAKDPAISGNGIYASNEAKTGYLTTLFSSLENGIFYKVLPEIVQQTVSQISLAGLVGSTTAQEFAVYNNFNNPDFDQNYRLSLGEGSDSGITKILFKKDTVPEGTFLSLEEQPKTFNYNFYSGNSNFTGVNFATEAQNLADLTGEQKQISFNNQNAQLLERGRSGSIPYFIFGE
jgi:filamentous hemagglutinin family protein